MGNHMCACFGTSLEDASVARCSDIERHCRITVHEYEGVTEGWRKCCGGRANSGKLAMSNAGHLCVVQHKSMTTSV